MMPTMQYISQNIMEEIKFIEKYHRDLAPNNILLYETNNELDVKIDDF